MRPPFNQTVKCSSYFNNDRFVEFTQNSNCYDKTNQLQNSSCSEFVEQYELLIYRGGVKILF